MSHENTISDEQLNAFVDQQLDQEDRERVLNATMKDQHLAEEVYSLYQMKELVQQAYRQPPDVARVSNPVRRRTELFRWAAMFVLFVTTAVSSYHWNKGGDFAQNAFFDMTSIQTNQFAGKRVLLHVDSNDPQRIKMAMQTVEKLMSKRQPEKIEVVANGAGLIMVRENSPHAIGVSSLAARYTNVEFKACGFAMEATRLKEGRPVVLVPEAEKVDAALNEILRRLQEGWVYIKA